MKIRLFVVTFMLFVLSGSLAAQNLPASAYWDDVELIDGQFLRASIVDRVKGRAVLQLSTRDFISLPETSIRKVWPGLARQAKALTVEQRDQWTLRWKGTRVTGTLSVLLLADGTKIEGVWVDTEAGHAVIVTPDGTATGVALALIRSVSTVTVAEASVPASDPVTSEPVTSESATLESATLESEVVEVELLAPFFDGLIAGWNALNAEPTGSDTAGFRSFFSPTALTLKSGELNVSQVAAAGTQLTYGITDNVQIQAGTVLPAFVVPDFGSLAQVGMQTSFALPNSGGASIRLSTLNWLVWTFSAAPADGGKTKLEFSSLVWLPEVLATISTGVWDTTVGVGVLGRGGSAPWLVTGSVSSLGRLAPHWAFLFEGNAGWAKDDEDWYQAVPGIRFWNPYLTVDLGVSWAGRNSLLSVLPVLNLSFKL